MFDKSDNSSLASGFRSFLNRLAGPREPWLLRHHFILTATATAFVIVFAAIFRGWL
ncbi:hypothetical protein [Amycolatopsis pigmentata]|uniref:Uncharacterized protein n=1 Tax=Amycolatopsis pigmentata TaxID=450801 RepID=A0ABW5G465_9PSEU